MRDKDGIILESLYGEVTLIKESKRVKIDITNRYLKNKDKIYAISELSDEDAKKKIEEIIDKLFEVDKTPSKADSEVLARMYANSNGQFTLEELIHAYEEFLDIRTNKDYKELDRYLEIDGTTGHLKKYREEAKNLQKFKTYEDFTSFVHTAQAYLGQAKEAKKNLGKKEEEQQIKEVDELMEQAVVNTEDVAIWEVNNRQEAVDWGQKLMKRYNNADCEWCITWGYPNSAPKHRNSSNQYANYRTNWHWSFYYILDKKTKDKATKVVAFNAGQDGRYGFTPYPNGSAMQVSWEEVVKKLPVIKPYKDILVYKQPTDEESKLDLFDTISRNRDLARFEQLTPEWKRDYLTMGNYNLSFDMFKVIADDKNLVNDYITRKGQNHGQDPATGGIDKKILDYLEENTPELLARYEREAIRGMEAFFEAGGAAPVGL